MRNIRASVKRKPIRKSLKVNSFVVKNSAKSKNNIIDNSYSEEEIINSKEYQNFENGVGFKSGHNYKATEESIENTRKKYPGLKMLQDRDPEEAREIRRKGAYAAQEARKRNKKLKEVLEEILDSNATLTDEQKKLAIQYGIVSKGTKKLNNKFLMMLVLMKRAMSGNIAAIEKIQDIIGENPWLEKVGQQQEQPGVNIIFKEGDLQ